jgi:hypothetical protein
LKTAPKKPFLPFIDFYIHENPVRAGIVEKPEDYIC